MKREKEKIFLKNTIGRRATMVNKPYRDDIQHLINNKVEKILNKFISYKDYNDLNLSIYLAKLLEKNITQNLYLDILSFAERDPASHGAPSIILHTYKSYEAVVYYRIANAIKYCQDLNEKLRNKFARQISEYAKNLTGIEINPGAKIGEGFVIDHGTGTVIGETAEIGKHCYILQGVILGARGISNNPKGKRHPCIGNNVEIGAFSRVLGPITVGDNVMIAPYTIILNDIPSNQKVLIKNQIQLIKSNISYNKLNVYALVPEENSVFVIYGEGLEDAQIKAINEEYIPIDNIKLNIQIKTNKYLKFRIENQYEKEIIHNINFQITVDENESIYLINNFSLNNFNMINSDKKCIQK
jgi:serine O-acetyltransferase